MKRFFIRVLVYSVVILLCSVLFLRTLVSFPNEYCLQSHEVNVIRQIERIQTIDEPKIVIIGGSGCGFGLCSKLISEHFNMPVCNTGTHAGIGLLTQLNLFKDYIHKDDIVVVIPEYSNYFLRTDYLCKNRYLGEITNLRILSSTYPIGYRSFSLRQQLHLIQYVPSAYKEAKKSRGIIIDENSPYSKESLNVYGDVERYEKRNYDNSIDWHSTIWEKPVIQRKAISILHEYHDYCRQRGATMLVFPQAYKAMNFDVNQVYIDSLWTTMREERLPLVSVPEHYRMTDSLCYDSPNHLTYEGVMIRTNRLIADMDSALRVYNNANTEEISLF